MDLMGNKSFDIVQLDEELLKTQKGRIFNLMKELESAHEKDYRQQKIKDMEKYIKDKSAIIFVALDSGKIIGYIWGYVRYNSQFPRVHITQFVVNPDYRCHGIGENLLKHIGNWAQKKGYNEIELNVSANNHGGIHFYERNKFIKKDIFMIKRLTQEINEDINLGGGV